MVAVGKKPSLPEPLVDTWRDEGSEQSPKTIPPQRTGVCLGRNRNKFSALLLVTQGGWVSGVASI